jgi:hypothetical protein
MLLVMLYIFYTYNFDFSTHFYYECKYQYCKNPFYNAQYTPHGLAKPRGVVCDWCNMEYVPRGIYGEKKPVVFNSFLILCLSSALLALCINHFIYNKGKNIFKHIEQGLEDLKNKYGGKE